MNEKVTIRITKDEAHRLTWALRNLSEWMNESNAPEQRKAEGIKVNKELIDRIRSAAGLYGPNYL